MTDFQIIFRPSLTKPITWFFDFPNRLPFTANQNVQLSRQPGAVARNQDKRLSRDIQVILDDFSFDLVARKQLELSPAK